MDGLKECPLFDAVAYASAMHQAALLTFIQRGPGSIANNGFAARCSNATCKLSTPPDESDLEPWCETLDLQ
eukprot:2846830-Rhodomonas_salina.1